MPLWIIFTKCPAPGGPQWRYPSSAVLRPARSSRPFVRPISPRPLLPPFRAPHLAAPGRQRAEDRVEPLDRLALAADHQAVAALEAPDAAAGAHVDVVDAAPGELAGAGDVVVVVRVAAVDQGV